MRISSSQIYTAGLDSVQKHTGDVLEAQRQISSGNRYQTVSENALAAGLGVQIQFKNISFEMFKTNQTFALSNLDATESQLQSIVSSIDRFKTLMVQANSTTIGADARANIGNELMSLKSMIAQFASAEDPSGIPIFRQLEASEVSKVYVAPSVDIIPVIRYEEVMGRISPSEASGSANFFDGISTMDQIIQAVSVDPPSLPVISVELFETMEKFSAQVLAALVKVGSIGRQLESASDVASAQEANVAQEKSLILETDLTESTASLTRANALLQAAQAIISKLDVNSLFQKL